MIVNIRMMRHMIVSNVVHTKGEEMNVSTKDALKALWANSKSSTVKSAKVTGRYLKQVGKAFVTNPNKEEQNEEK
jgi:hypothetical protein